SFVKAYASLVSLRATCRDEQFRDGKSALEFAKKAVELDGGKTADAPAALAAAYAELGDFEQAVHWQTKALELIKQEKNKSQANDRLQLYRSGKPYRERPTPSQAGSDEPTKSGKLR